LAGHNKWSKIKHRKAVVDKRRGKAWSMCSRAIISAARQGGPDPNFNFALRAAIDEARYHNVPGDNIERAIKKGAGGGEGDNYEPVRYEGYGPGGVAVIVEAFTDNRARTAGNVRLIFSDHEGKLGTAGSVAHQFDHKGRLRIEAPARDEDRLIEAALEAGAEDVRRLDEGEADTAAGFEVLTPPTSFLQVRKALGEAGFTIAEAELDMIPNITVAVAGVQAKALLAFVEAMEDDEDVKKVFTNADLAEADLAMLED
jgi:YebC/PmpR family DNA-binding regulatory protein